MLPVRPQPPWLPFIAFCCCFACAQAVSLIQLQLVFRHGIRYPLKLLPNDPYRAVYNGSLGQLTPAGVSQMAELGRYVRKRYTGQKLIPEKYVPGQVFAYSSDTDRTLASGRAFLDALFPPDGKISFPVPLHRVSGPLQSAPLKPTGYPCPARDSLIDQSMHSRAFKSEEARTRDLLDRMKQATGKANFGLRDAWTLGSSAQMWLGMGLELPTWLSTGDYQRLLVSRVRKYELLFENAPVRMFCGGPLLAKILDAARARLLNSPNSSHILVYSGHDSTISALVATLGVPLASLGFPPPPAALMAVEVYDDGTVRFVYRNSTQFAPKLLRPPGCAASAASDVDCTVDQVASQVGERVLGANLGAECRLYQPLFTSGRRAFAAGALLMLGLACCVGVLALLVLVGCRRRLRRRDRKRRQKVGGGGSSYEYAPLATSAAEDEALENGAL